MGFLKAKMSGSSGSSSSHSEKDSNEEYSDEEYSDEEYSDESTKSSQVSNTSDNDKRYREGPPKAITIINADAGPSAHGNIETSIPHEIFYPLYVVAKRTQTIQCELTRKELEKNFSDNCARKADEIRVERFVNWSDKFMEYEVVPSLRTVAGNVAKNPEVRFRRGRKTGTELTCSPKVIPNVSQVSPSHSKGAAIELDSRTRSSSAKPPPRCIVDSIRQSNVDDWWVDANKKTKEPLFERVKIEVKDITKVKDANYYRARVALYPMSIWNYPRGSTISTLTEETRARLEALPLKIPKVLEKLGFRNLISLGTSKNTLRAWFLFWLLPVKECKAWIDKIIEVANGCLEHLKIARSYLEQHTGVGDQLYSLAQKLKILQFNKAPLGSDHARARDVQRGKPKAERRVMVELELNNMLLLLNSVFVLSMFQDETWKFQKGTLVKFPIHIPKARGSRSAKGRISLQVVVDQPVDEPAGVYLPIDIKLGYQEWNRGGTSFLDIQIQDSDDPHNPETRKKVRESMIQYIAKIFGKIPYKEYGELAITFHKFYSNLVFDVRQWKSILETHACWAITSKDTQNKSYLDGVCESMEKKARDIDKVIAEINEINDRF